jgi:hypothetical protein
MSLARRTTSPIRPDAGRAPGPAGAVLRRKCACGGRKCPACGAEEREGLLRRSATGPAPAEGVGPVAPPIVRDVLSEPGRPLDAATRTDLGARFGRDFGPVRVHDGGRAAASARAIDAAAYTVGNDVVFGAGRYAPGASAGRSLLAHELAHVAQQSGAPAPAGPILMAGDRGVEAEADRAAARIASGRPAGPISSAPAGVVSRQPAGGTPPPPAWLNGVRVVRWVTGGIYEINLTTYGPAFVGPYTELRAYLKAQGIAEEAHHIVGREHLGDVPTGFTDANAPSVGLEGNIHDAISTYIGAGQKELGGRRGGRAAVTHAEVGERYHDVYSTVLDFPELNVISDNVLGVRTITPPASGVGGGRGGSSSSGSGSGSAGGGKGPTPAGGGGGGAGGGTGTATASRVQVGARALKSESQPNGSTVSEVEILLSDGLDVVHSAAPTGKGLPSRMALKITQDADGAVVAAESLTGESQALARALAEKLVAAGTDAVIGESGGAAGGLGSAAGRSIRGALGGLRASTILLKGLHYGGTALFVIMTGYQHITASDKERPKVAVKAAGGFAAGTLGSYLVCNLALDLETAGGGIIICGLVVVGAAGYAGSEAGGAIYDDLTMTELEKALRDLNDGPRNVARLFYAMIGKAGEKGLPIGASFVRRFMAEVPGDLTEIELYALAGSLGPIDPASSLDDVLKSLHNAIAGLPERGAGGFPRRPGRSSSSRRSRERSPTPTRSASSGAATRSRSAGRGTPGSSSRRPRAAPGRRPARPAVGAAVPDPDPTESPVIPRPRVREARSSRSRRRGRLE